jgi:hypothetical protein
MKSPDWPHPSAQWIRDIQSLVELDARLPKVLKGEIQLTSAADFLQLARFCHSDKQLPAAAARLFAEAFAKDSKLLDDPRPGNIYAAASAAAMAGTGQGKDAAELDAQERARLRRQSLDWLQKEFKAWRALSLAKDEPAFQDAMRHWREDAGLAGVRGQALDKLPETERLDWQKLWDEVEALKSRLRKTR